MYIPSRSRGFDAIHQYYAMLFSAMKLLFGITILVLVAGSVFADYKWKQWIKARRESREQDSNTHGSGH